MPRTRQWVGRSRYNGLDEFYIGTVQAESEMGALVALKALWATISPHPFPDMVVMIPGMLTLEMAEA